VHGVEHHKLSMMIVVVVSGGSGVANCRDTANHVEVDAFGRGSCSPVRVGEVNHHKRVHLNLCAKGGMGRVHGVCKRHKLSVVAAGGPGTAGSVRLQTGLRSCCVDPQLLSLCEVGEVGQHRRVHLHQCT
jgi:hypothetical protein